MPAIGRIGGNDSRRIEEAAIHLLRNAGIVLGEQLGFFDRMAPEIIEECIPGGDDMRGRHDQDFRNGTARIVVVVLHQHDQPLDAKRGVEGATTIGIFDVVCAEHDDDEIKRLVRFQQDRQRHRTVAVSLAGRVGKHGRAAVHPLLDDAETGAKSRCERIRPAVFKTVTLPRAGLKTPGQRVAKCEDGLHALQTLP
jgi:hypothetical protein